MIQQAISNTDFASGKSQRMRLGGIILKQSDKQTIEDALIRIPSIKSLELVGCIISQSMLLDLARVLRHSSLISLQITGLPMSIQVVQAFAIAIQESCLKKLDFSQTAISAVAFTALVQGIIDSGIESLVLNNNLIGNAIGTLAAYVVENKTSLKVLALRRNDLRDNGAIEVSKIIKHSELERLHLDLNRITACGIIAVCDAIASHGHRMLDLTLSGNLIPSKEAFVSICNMLKSSSLEHLALNLCDIHDEHLLMLAEGVCSSPTLQVLELKANSNISDAAMTLFMEKVGSHRTLRCIDTVGIPLTQRCVEFIRRKLEAMHSKKASALTAIVSANTLLRIGSQSTLKLLPRDLLRLLGNYLAH